MSDILQQLQALQAQGVSWQLLFNGTGATNPAPVAPVDPAQEIAVAKVRMLDHFYAQLPAEKQVGVLKATVGHVEPHLTGLGINWAGLAGIAVKVGLTLVQQILAGMFPAPTPAPVAPPAPAPVVVP